MSKRRKVLCKNPGQASLVLVLILGFAAIVSVLASSSISVSSAQIEATAIASNQAWYAAWSGIDELMYRLRSKQDFGAGPYTVNLTLANGATVSAQIQGDDIQKTVTATGFAADAVRRLEVKVASSSSKASFIFAAQAGEGGFEMEGQSTVIGEGNVDGNVYSNGDVLGKSNSSGNAGSRILGSVWAVGKIGKLTPGSGPYILKNAYAGVVNECRVGIVGDPQTGNITAPLPPGASCPYTGTFTLGNAPPAVPLASVDANYWKTQAELGGTWVGNCNISALDGTDCTNGTNILGNVKITGDLTLPQGTNLTIDGPIWVVGDFSIAQNNILQASETLGKDSVVLVTSDPADPLNKGKIVTASNVEYKLNSQGAGLIFIAENQGIDCADPAILMSSNTATVVFVAQDGCIKIASGSVISGVLGKKVYLSNNSSVRYDPALAQAIISTDSGGWAVTSVKEY